MATAGGSNPKASSIRTSDLRTRVANVATTTNYIVKLQPPPLVAAYLRDKGFNYTSDDGYNVELSCNVAQLPGSSFSTHEQRNDYSGVTERMVYRREYDTNLSFTFMVNNQYDAVEMFDGWMDLIAGQEDTSSFLSPYASYRTSYANDYRTNIHITKFEKNVDAKSLKGERPRELRYTMVGAYPISTQPMQVGYGDKNNMLQYSVYMTFIRYVRERVDA